jgi:hypothetical protein
LVNRLLAEELVRQFAGSGLWLGIGTFDFNGSCRTGQGIRLATGDSVGASVAKFPDAGNLGAAAFAQLGVNDHQLSGASKGNYFFL